MGFYAKLSLRKKIVLAFGVSLVFISGIIAVGVAYMLWMKGATESAYRQLAVEAQASFRLKHSIEEVRRHLLMTLLSVDKAVIRESMAGIDAATAEIERDLGLMLSSAESGPEARAEAARLKGIWEDFKATRDDAIIPLVVSGQRAAAIETALGIQAERFNEFEAITKRMIERSNAEAGKVRASLSSAFARMIALYAAISLAGLAVAAFLLVRLVREIDGRFRNAADAIESFRKDGRPPKLEAGTDELGHVEGALDELFSQVYEDRVAREQYMGIISWEAREKERQRAEIQAKEERFRALVETTSDFVWEVGPSDDYTYASPRVLEILGYGPEEMLGRTPFDFMPPGEAGRIRAAFRDIASRGEAFSALVNRNLHKDGREVILETSGVPFFDASGRLLGYRGVDRDITGRKRAEEEKAAMAEQLMRSEKLASIGQLAAGVAHEINTPVGYVKSNLNTLSGYINDITGLFKMYYSMMEAVEENRVADATGWKRKILEYQREVDIGFLIEDVVFTTEESKEGMRRIEAIVKGLRDFSHSGGGDMQTHDINRCIEDAIRLSWHEIKNSASLEKKLSELPPVPCRQQQITQVFMNMIINSVHALEGRKGSIWIESAVEGGDVLVTIRDNGAGMSDDVKRRIFDPFFTTKPVGKGTGLGLSIAYGIISEHKGSIQVKSAPGEGTAFFIRIPLSQEIYSAA